MRRWSPREKTEVLGKFRRGWIDLRGLPFHLWSEEHSKKIVEKGTMVEIDWRIVKLFDLSKARVKISMKEHTVLIALIKVKDGRWAFTISVVVVGVEDEKWVRGMAELTRRKNESHSRTGGRRMIEKENLTTKV